MLQRVGHDLATEQQKTQAEHSYNVSASSLYWKGQNFRRKKGISALVFQGVCTDFNTFFFLSTLGLLCSPANILLPYLTTVRTLELGGHSHPRASIRSHSRNTFLHTVFSLRAVSCATFLLPNRIIWLIFFKFYFIFKLYIIVLVMLNIKMNLPQAYINLTNLIMLPMRLMIQRST